jgi:two-component system nitrate/nitrite response regulator NarL
MRIVICDDHQLLLEALATALALQGITVEAAVESPSEAVRAVAENDPDILLIDVTFPVGSGLDAAREVVAHHPRTKVVMMTGTEETEPLKEALGLGVAGYLAKDQPVDAIARALDLAGQGGNPIDSEMLRKVQRPAPRIPRQRSPIDELTPREHHILRLLVDGMSTREMVDVLGVSQSTVRTHVQNIFAKLGVHTRLQAVALLDPETDPTVREAGLAAGR